MIEKETRVGYMTLDRLATEMKKTIVALKDMPESPTYLVAINNYNRIVDYLEGLN